MERYYDRYLPKRLNACTTCHLPSDNKSPESAKSRGDARQRLRDCKPRHDEKYLNPDPEIIENLNEALAA